MSFLHPQAQPKPPASVIAWLIPVTLQFYFSNAFDFGAIIIDTNDVQREFDEYLRGRFEFRRNGSYLVACPAASLYTLAQAQNAKRDYENRFRQQNKQIIEVDWTYSPDPRSLATSGPIPQHRMPSINSGLTPDHTFCISETYSSTVYYTGPVQTGTSVNLSSWNIGFTQYLKQRYSFQGKVNCNMGPRPIVTRLVNAHLDGARAANKKIVDTGWHYDPNTANAGPPQQEEDREPARPSGPSTSQTSQSELQQAREAARVERPASMDYCRKDPILAAVFSCPSFANAVFAYRVAHHADAGSQIPLEKLLGTENFACTGCVNGVQVMIWVNRRAAAEKLRPPVTTCTVQTLTKTLNNNTPRIRRLEEFYKDAVAQCSH